VAGEQAAGLIDIARAQCLKDQAVVLVGPRPPGRTTRHREYEPRIGKLQSVEARKQPWHGAGRHQRAVKGAVGGFEFAKRLRIVGFDQRRNGASGCSAPLIIRSPIEEAIRAAVVKFLSESIIDYLPQNRMRCLRVSDSMAPVTQLIDNLMDYL